MVNSELKDLINNKSMRFTKARSLIFEVLSKHDKSLNAQEIFHKLEKNKKNHIDLVSIYRNLAVFEKMGLVHKTNNRFSLCSHDKSHHRCSSHIIVQCSCCGQSKEIDHNSSSICELSKKMNSLKGSLKKISSITISGICQDCG